MQNLESGRTTSATTTTRAIITRAMVFTFVPNRGSSGSGHVKIVPEFAERGAVESPIYAEMIRVFFLLSDSSRSFVR